MRAGDEHHQVAAQLRVADIGHPVGDTPVELRGGLRRNREIARNPVGARSPDPGARFPDLELFEDGGVGELRGNILARDHQLRGRGLQYGRALRPRLGLRKRRLDLFPRRFDLLPHIIRLGDKEPEVSAGTQILKQIRC